MNAHDEEEFEALMRECEDAERERALAAQDPYAGWESDPDLAAIQNEDDSPPHRAIIIKVNELVAHFDGAPVNELWVYRADVDAPLELPYFSPEGKTDEELARTIRKLLPFA